MTTIRVELQLADGSFTTGMLRAGQSLEQFERQLVRNNPALQAMAANGTNVVRTMTRMETSTKSFLSTIRDLSIVTTAAAMGVGAVSRAANGWVGDIVRINAEMERLNFQMQSLSTAADPVKDAADNVKYLREQAASMPFALSTITSSFVKLKASGLDPTDGSLRAIADGIAAFGGTDEQMNRVVLGLTQMSGKAVVSMEEMRQQIGESMPDAMNIMARSMGLSVGQLAKEIATGTVASEGAIKRFTDELERTYGGTALRTMETFSGQWSQMMTNLQNLATADGGRGFFEGVKGQLTDFNRFLRSDFAGVLANDVGNALSSLIGYLRSTVSVIWEFRDTITNVAAVLATAFGVSAAIRGLAELRAAVAATSLSFTQLGAGWRNANYNLAVGFSGFARLGTAMDGARIFASGLAGAIATVGGTLMTMAPWLVAFGLAAYTAGEYFGWFSNKVADAYEEVKKFGAETRNQAEEITGRYIAQLEQQLADERKRVAEDEYLGAIKPEDVDETMGSVGELMAKLKKAQDESVKIIGDATEREKRARLDQLQKDIEDRTAETRAGYQTEVVELRKKYEEELKLVAAGTRSLSAAEENYRKNLLNAQKGLSDEKIGVLEQEIAKRADIIKAGSENERRMATAENEYLTEQLSAELEARARLTAENIRMDRTSSPKSEDELIKDGRRVLDNLRQDISGLDAELNGANSAVAEMLYRIQRGDFGNIDDASDKVRQLHEELLTATAQKEALDKVMKGRQRIEGDIEKIKTDQLEQQARILEEMAGNDLNEPEKALLRLKNGLYDGLGPAENIKKAIEGVVGTLEAQGMTADEVNRVMVNKTFSDATNNKITTVADSIRRVAQELTGVGASLNGLDWSRMGQGMMQPGMFNTISPLMTGASPNAQLFAPGDVSGQTKMGVPLSQIETTKGLKAQVNAAYAENFQGFLKDLEATGYDIRDIGGYNYRNIRGTNKLSEHAGGDAIDINHKENPDTGRGGELITDMDPATVRALAAKWGLEWGGDWKSKKDAMHFQVSDALKNSTATGPTIANAAQVTPAEAAPFDNTAAQQRLALIEKQVAATKTYEQTLEDAIVKQEDLDNQEGALVLKKRLDALRAATEATGDETEKFGEQYKSLYEDIKNGKINPNERNPEAEMYKEALAAAQALDDKNKQIAETKKNQTAIDRDIERFEERRVEIARRINEEKKKAADPNYQADSSEMQRLVSDLDAYIAKVKEAEGADYASSQKYKDAVAYKSQLIAQQGQLEGAQVRAKWAEENRQVAMSLGTQTQQRQAAMAQQMALVDQMAAKMRANGEDEVTITKAVEERKAAIRQEYAQQGNAFTQQMDQWSDAQGQLAAGAARWTDSLAGGLTDVIMGTGDLRTAIQGILRDMVNMGLKYMMGQMFQGMKGGANPTAATGKSGKMGKAAAPAAVATGGKSGKLGTFATAHTGGIIGSSGLGSKAVSPLVFAGAPKFHKGGIVGSRLQPSEVPIIAKKGEGVFTPEQMANMGGFSSNQAISISAPISVQGSAGTPEQNADLARRMKQEMEGTMRGVVADELRRQMRPGNMLNNANRR